MASAIINLISITASLIMSILLMLYQEELAAYLEYYYFLSYSTNIIYVVISFAVGLVGSILLLFSIRQKGKYFRTSHGCYLAGFIIIVICGGYLPWILLFISMFVSDVVVINRPSEVRQEERKEEQAYEEKKRKIEELKQMRDSGLITEEEYKQKLFEIL